MNGHTVVVGEGPAGMIVALHLLSLGHTVTFIEEREDPFARKRRIALSRNFLNHIMQHFTNLSLHGYVIDYLDIGRSKYQLKFTIDPTLQMEFKKVAAKEGWQIPDIEQIDRDFFDLVMRNDGILWIQEVQLYLSAKLEEKISNKEQLETAKRYQLSMNIFQELVDNLKNPEINILWQKIIRANPSRNSFGFRMPDYVAKKYYADIFDLFLNKILDLRLTINSESIESWIKLANSKALETLSHHLQQPYKIIKPVTIVDIDCTNGALKLSDEQKIYFDDIVIAEGASRKTANLLFDKKDKKLDIKHLPMPHGNKSSYGIARINVSNLDEALKKRIENNPIIAPFVDKSSRLTMQYLPVLSKFGWGKKNLPISYVQFIKDSNQFYFTSEVPEHFDKLSKQELEPAMQNWATTILTIQYPYLKPDNLQLALGEKGHVVLFGVDPSHIEKAFLDLGNKRRAFIIGDCLLAANFLFGHGLLNSALGAYAVAQCFSLFGCFVSSQPALELLKALCKDYLQINRMYRALLYLNKNPIQKELFLQVSVRCSQANYAMFWLYNKAKAKTGMIDDRQKLKNRGPF